jgi:hypothetical protein
VTPEERWQRIEEKHLALAQSVELLTHDVHGLQKQQETMLKEQERLDARERQARGALLTGIAAYLKALDDNKNGAK